MIVVSDASPIIGLAAIGHLDLIRKMYKRVVIPEAVYREIAVAGGGQPGGDEVQSEDWIVTQSVSELRLINALKIELDEGETEAIALAVEINAELVLIDERRARAVAARFGLDVVGILDVLVEAKQQNLFTTLKPLLDDLILKAGFRISEKLYKRVLQKVEEKAQ